VRIVLPLPAGLKVSTCPSCQGTAPVLAPAAPDLKCARCAPPWMPRRRTWQAAA
jgi:hypothetical protein